MSSISKKTQKTLMQGLKIWGDANLISIIYQKLLVMPWFKEYSCWRQLKSLVNFGSCQHHIPLLLTHERLFWSRFFGVVGEVLLLLWHGRAVIKSCTLSGKKNKTQLISINNLKVPVYHFIKTSQSRSALDCTNKYRDKWRSFIFFCY